MGINLVVDPKRFCWNVLHEAAMIEDFAGIDVFRPTPRGWRDGTDNYLRQANQAK
jgi:hypothetical protein